MVINYLTALFFGAALFVILAIFNKKLNKKIHVALKVVSLLLAALFYVRFCLGDTNLEWVQGVFKATDGATTIFDVGMNKVTGSLGFLQMWFTYTSLLLIILYPFFNARSQRAHVTFFSLPVAALNTAFLFNHVTAVCGPSGAFSARSILLSAETGILLGYSLYVTIFGQGERLLKGKGALWAVAALVGMLICSAPNYTLQFFLTKGSFAMTAFDMNIYHRIYVYPIVIIPIALYFILKDLPLETKRYVLLYYSLGILIGFMQSQKFKNFGDVTALPLHLCNTALFITPICLMFRLKKLFYFTYFINVLGALLAITMPNYSNGGIIVNGTVEFFRSHYQAFFMPLLTVGIGVFERPRMKEFKYSLVAFTVYFFSIVLINAWFTNYNPDVDYFFVNSNFIADKLGTWAENLRNFTLDFNVGSLNFKFYPAYQIPYFLVYFAASFGVWFVYELAYGVVKSWQDIADRNKKISLDRLAFLSQLNGREEDEPLNMEGTNKLVLKNFTKRYGKSDVYAVKDANLEVVGGEIFGFLGPNGAGKSTIIKSIVGIQTITGGAIEVCGYDVSKQPVMAKRQIGFVPDHYALYEKLTAREYINYIADLYHVSQEDRDARLNNFIKLFEFESAIDNQIRTYSHGMKQKVTIMSALIHNPKVWILDEPLTGLDPNSIFQVKECMRQHAEAGNIVFFSSHIIDVVERICDRIAIINKGQIQCVESIKDLEERNILLEDYYMGVIENSNVKAIAVEE